MESWKSGWANNMKNAGKKHIEAVEQIDKAIKDLQKARDALTLSDKHLLTAENKMDDLTIKRLTKNAPSVAARFDELEES
jgi:exonuclease VII small subunit